MANKTSVVKNLGWANGWQQTPEIVLMCRDQKHRISERNLDSTQHGLDTEVRCDVCGYVYHYDSSD